MALVAPFQGIRYNPALVSDPDRVVAPPYDIISPKEQKALHRAHPQNIIRLELGLTRPGDTARNNRYTRAARALRTWLRREIIIRDPMPALYPYHVAYRLRDGRKRTLRGFMAAVRLEDMESGRILPHEHTLSKPKADRLSLLKACRANLSPIFALYSDPKGVVDRLLTQAMDRRPLTRARDRDGHAHRLWGVTDKGVLKAVAARLRPKPLFIADGHHRYETALAFRNARRKQARLSAGQAGRWTGREPENYVLMFLSNLEGEGLTLLPIHRMIHRAPPSTLSGLADCAGRWFDATVYPWTSASEPKARRALLRRLEAIPRGFGLARQDERAYTVLRLKSGLRPEALVPGNHSRAYKGLGVTLLKDLVLKQCLGIGPKALAAGTHVTYTHSTKEALEAVRQGHARAAFLLNPTGVKEVRAVARAGEKMPQKSTYFYPKLLTGLVMRAWE